MSDVIQVRSEDIEEIQKSFDKESEAIGALRSKLNGANDKQRISDGEDFTTCVRWSPRRSTDGK